MNISQGLVYFLIFLPALIAIARRCDYWAIIILVCSAIATSNFMDIHEALANRSAHHSMVLFFIEILAWLPTFILSVYARNKADSN